MHLIDTRKGQRVRIISKERVLQKKISHLGREGRKKTYEDFSAGETARPGRGCPATVLGWTLRGQKVVLRGSCPLQTGYTAPRCVASHRLPNADWLLSEVPPPQL